MAGTTAALGFDDNVPAWGILGAGDNARGEVRVIVRQGVEISPRRIDRPAGDIRGGPPIGTGDEMGTRPTTTSIDEYIQGFPCETQKALEEMRALIKAVAPDATETISYAIPTFDLNGRHLVHFAGFAKQVGFYPIPSATEAFKEDLEPYKRGKGSVQFPLGEPLPTDLIRRIVEFWVSENRRKA